MNKGVKRSHTGYKGLADISTIQGIEPLPLTLFTLISTLDSSDLLATLMECR